MGGKRHIGVDVTRNPFNNNPHDRMRTLLTSSPPTPQTMNLFGSLLSYFQYSDAHAPTSLYPATADIERASRCYTLVRTSIQFHLWRGRLDPVGEQAAREFLEELAEETPVWIFLRWVKVRKAGEESKVYTPEMLRTLILQWERWSDQKAVEKEFSFLMKNGEWHLRRGDRYSLPVEPIVEGMKMWLEERRRLGK